MTKEMFELALLRLFQDYPTIKGDFEYPEDWIRYEVESLPFIGLPENWDSKLARSKYKQLYDKALGR